MLTSEQQTHKPKQSKIRYTEYYDLQNTFDRLYADSLKGKTFQNLVGLMASEENIKLAYRTIKGNKGSGTPGVDKRTIKHLASMEEEKFVRLIQKQFSWYNPRPVRRVEIPKPNGKTRPLGIPTIVDRIVQQCILQVLEPICEAKFHERSNGFRPNRSTEHAIAQCCRLMQIQHLHYAVDLDIHGFFDNVHHGKLIRQMWELGIRDKKLLCIIKQMLRAPIVLPDGKRIYPTKGTPQGGILSPLLSNIVLNELDWWVSSQWENMPTHYEYKTRQNAHGTDIKSHTYRALRRSNLKEMYPIRDHISCPILFLTARIEDTDKVNGFAVGGDDYIVKPFSLMELEARVCAHLRREARHNFEAQVKFSGDLTIDYSERCLFFGDKRVGLAKKEFDIVELLSQNPGQVFDKERIRRVVGQLYEVFDLNSVEDAKEKYHSSPY